MYLGTNLEVNAALGGLHIPHFLPSSADRDNINCNLWSPQTVYIDKYRPIRDVIKSKNIRGIMTSLTLYDKTSQFHESLHVSNLHVTVRVRVPTVLLYRGDSARVSLEASHRLVQNLCLPVNIVSMRLPVTFCRSLVCLWRASNLWSRGQ